MPGGKKPTKTQRLVCAAFHEVKHNPPVRLVQTGRRQGASAARKMATAIALDEARAKGARVPRKRKQG